MLGGLFLSSRANIAKNSSHNTIIQDSVINTPIILEDSSDSIAVLAELGQYDRIQKRTIGVLAAAKRSHPLYPTFSATYNDKLKRLISTPETVDAFETYPKFIKGAFQIDYEKYPHMDKGETPWEYAFRTQTPIELSTQSYQEYLGDIIDPFPITEYFDGMRTVIEAPEFPSAVPASIKAGDVSVPVMFRRIPCMEYGKTVFGTVSNGHGFSLSMTINEAMDKTTVNIIKKQDADLAAQLLREELIHAIKNTNKITIYIGESELVRSELNEAELNTEMFRVAPILIRYISNLILIEKNTGCHFDPIIGDVSQVDFHLAAIIASSLEKKWYAERTDFDSSVRCDYDHIIIGTGGNPSAESQLVSEMQLSNISLQGQCFKTEKYVIVYKDARINNIDSVIKNVNKKKKNILITIRPVVGKDEFNKYMMFEGICLSSEI